MMRIPQTHRRVPRPIPGFAILMFAILGTGCSSSEKKRTGRFRSGGTRAKGPHRTNRFRRSCLSIRSSRPSSRPRSLPQLKNFACIGEAASTRVSCSRSWKMRISPPRPNKAKVNSNKPRPATPPRLSQACSGNSEGGARRGRRQGCLRRTAKSL